MTKMGASWDADLRYYVALFYDIDLSPHHGYTQRSVELTCRWVASIMNYQEVIFWLRLIGFVTVSLEYIFHNNTVESINEQIFEYTNDRHNYSRTILNKWVILFQQKRKRIILSMLCISAIYVYIYIIKQKNFEYLSSEMLMIFLFFAWGAGFVYLLKLIVPDLIVDICIAVPFTFVTGFISKNKDKSVKAIGFLLVALSYIIEYYFKFLKH